MAKRSRGRLLLLVLLLLLLLRNPTCQQGQPASNPLCGPNVPICRMPYNLPTHTYTQRQTHLSPPLLLSAPPAPVTTACLSPVCHVTTHLSVTMSSTAPSVDVWLKVRAALPSSSSHTNLYSVCIHVRVLT